MEKCPNLTKKFKMMNLYSRIFVAGGTGMVGSAIVRQLKSLGYENVQAPPRDFVDLTIQTDVTSYFSVYKPDYVFLAAAKVGGIHSNNKHPADYINENLQIELNVINAAHNVKVKKLIFLGSVCAYPKEINRPLLETDLLTGLVEPTSRFYALAKIAGIQLCEAFKRQYDDNFISAIPCNTYGINDNYDPEESHVIPALIKKIHDAKRNNISEIICWGTGSPLREFLYVDDVANALVFLMNNYNKTSHVNIGGGEEVSMKTLAEKIAKICKYDGKISWDTNKPDGMHRRLLNSITLRDMGWSPKISLDSGLKLAYDAFLKQQTNV